MRKLIFAAALSIGSVALAQNQPAQQEPAEPTEEAQPAPEAAQPPANAPAAQTQTQPSGETVDDPSQSTGPQGITQQGTDPNGQATAPPGTNQRPQMMHPEMQSSQTAAFAPRAAAGEYPPCSRTVTDGCIQTYERGVRAARRRR